MRLGREFFERYTPDVARDLLGCLLVRRVGRVTISGKIVETEAYRGADDPASHSFRGPTKRSEIMFGEAGHVYVFFSYGNHWCLNFTTEPEGRKPGAVLIRALQPADGVAQMRRMRGVERLEDLTNGPGKLTEALAIGKEFNHEDVVESSRILLLGREKSVRIKTSTRIGISQAVKKRWRFFLNGNPFVSKTR